MHVESSTRRRHSTRGSLRQLFFCGLIYVVLAITVPIVPALLVRQQFKAIRERGEPLTVAGMLPAVTPARQKSADYYRLALAQVKLTPADFAAVGDLDTSNRASVSGVQAIVTRNQAALDFTLHAVAVEEGAFPARWVTYPGRPESNLNCARQLAQLLSARARLAAVAGNQRAAVGDVEAIFALGKALSDAPTYLGLLMHQVIEAIGNRALGEVLEKSSLSLADGLALQAKLPRTDWNRELLHSLLGDRTDTIGKYESLKATVRNLPESQAVAPDEAIFHFVSLRPAALLGKVNWDEAMTLSRWGQMLDILNQNAGPLSVPDEAKLQRLAIEPSIRGFWFAIPLPEICRAVDLREHSELMSSLRQVALQLSGYRTACGNYPATLPELVKWSGHPLPLDPYDGVTFKYRRSRGTFALYSVGKNHKDDGGRGQLGLLRHDRLPGDAADDLAWMPLGVNNHGKITWFAN